MDAMLVVQPGAEIRLLPGGHSEMFLVNPPPDLHITSADAQNPAEVHPGRDKRAAIVLMNAAGATVSNLVVNTPHLVGLELVLCQDVTVSGCVFKNAKEMVSDESQLVCPYPFPHGCAFLDWLCGLP